MTTGKRAFKAESRAKRVIFFKGKFEELYGRFITDPFSIEDVRDKLFKKYPKEKGLLLIAEREFYQELKKTKTPQTNT